jgi:predicted DNA-binding transcriptional regulator YafY
MKKLKKVSSPSGKPSAPRKPPTAKERQLTRPPLQRIMHIDARLRTKTYPSYAKLAVETKVTRRTIIRDVEFMRSRLNLPIEADQKRGLYYSREDVPLPLMQMTESELIAFCVARRALESYRGTCFEVPLRNAFEKITQFMDDKVSFQWDEVTSAISFGSSSMLPPVDLKTFETLSSAVLNSEEIKFPYRKPRGHKEEQRHVQPLQLKYDDELWYLVALDLDRDGKQRNFALHRMRDPRGTGKRFQRPDPSTWKAELDSAIGIYSGAPVAKVRLQCSPLATDLLKDKPIHASQRLTKKPDGTAELTMKVALTPVLERIVLGWGAEVRVLEPESLRDSVTATARKILAWAEEGA